MFSEILTPMNHREIEYNAKKLSGCDIPDSSICTWASGERLPAGLTDAQSDCGQSLLEWIDETGKRVFDEDLIMDYGTDCLRLYLLFENTPKENDAPYYDSWQEGALEGIYKFLGRYRRMVLAADAWNRCGNYNYNEETLSVEQIGQMNQALEDTVAVIRKCIRRGNTMPNRHHIVSALMALLKVFQKELRTGEIVTSLRAHAVSTTSPHSGMEAGHASEQPSGDRRNPAVTKLYQGFVILMAPYAPNLSRILWETIE